MLIQRNIFFDLKRRAGSEHKPLSIRMRVRVKGYPLLDFNIGYTVLAQDWDGENCRVLGSSKEAVHINKTIDEFRQQMDDLFARYEVLEKRIPEPEEIKTLFNDMIGRRSIMDSFPVITYSLYETFDYFIDQMGRQNQWTTATRQKVKQVRGHLKKALPRLSFDTLNEERLQDLIAYYLRNGYRNTTIAKQISFLRWFLRWAYQRGYYKGNLHETFRPKIKGTSVDSKEIIYLSMDELKQIQELEFDPSNQHLERVRDVFLFQCFTGLRYSDVAKLRRSDIKRGAIHIVTQKTLDGLRIELNKHSQAILDKYKDCKFYDDKALPVISNVKSNLNLKTIGQLAGLDEPTRIVYFKGSRRIEEVYRKWELLTTHVARRTFVVMALQLGIPVEVIMRWTGHSSYDAMKPYIKIVDELKTKSMSKFDMV